jgi:NAD-dependent dihydropyrimidine dehydrogenase PreA subunit
MLETLEAITRGRRGEPADTTALERFRGVTAMEKLGDVIRSTSLCGLGQTAPNPVLSTLRWFRDEYEAHVFERRCPAGVCRDLLEYSIDPDRCRGCTLCAGKCPTEAIMGAPKSPHYIIPDKCIGCGSCAEVCPFDAVEVG